MSAALRLEPPRGLVAVVDDDREVREWLADSLRDAGYQVALASNGLRLVSALQVDRPDLILLDVNMSWIDGFELCRAIKKNEEFQDIPVIFISAKKTPQDVRVGLDAGAVDYFPKPIDVDKLTRRIHELLEKRGAPQASP